jgi:hypothetical protein
MAANLRFGLNSIPLPAGTSPFVENPTFSKQTGYWGLPIPKHRSLKIKKFVEFFKNLLTPLIDYDTMVL